MNEKSPRGKGPWVPAACTLPTARQPARAADWGDLLGTAVLDIRRVTRTSALLTLRPDPLVAARAADLAARETQCCSFFTFTHIAAGGMLTLGIVVPFGQVGALDALLGLAPAIRIGGS